MKFTEEKLELAIIDLLKQEGFYHFVGNDIARSSNSDVLIKDDLISFLKKRYNEDGITQNEIESIIRKLEVFPHSDLYESNKEIIKLISNGFLLKREDRSQKDLFIELIDFSKDQQNNYKAWNTSSARARAVSCFTIGAG